MSFSANGGAGGVGKGASSEINVTPLIDIVLVLLIIFMVMTPMTLKELTAAIPRKATEEGAPPPATPPIVVRLDASGDLFLSGEPVSPEALPPAVAERLRPDRKKIVFFDVDDSASYGRAVKLMDLCKGAGAKVLGIVTRD